MPTHHVLYGRESVLREKTSALTSNILVLRAISKCDDKNDKIWHYSLELSSYEKTRVKKKPYVLPTKRKMSQRNGWCEVCTYTSQYDCYNLHNCDISHKLIQVMTVLCAKM